MSNNNNNYNNNNYNNNNNYYMNNNLDSFPTAQDLRRNYVPSTWDPVNRTDTPYWVLDIESQEVYQYVSLAGGKNLNQIRIKDRNGNFTQPTAKKGRFIFFKNKFLGDKHRLPVLNFEADTTKSPTFNRPPIGLLGNPVPYISQPFFKQEQLSDRNTQQATIHQNLDNNLIENQEIPIVDQVQPPSMNNDQNLDDNLIENQEIPIVDQVQPPSMNNDQNIMNMVENLLRSLNIADYDHVKLALELHRFRRDKQ
ncbi:cAMP-dependent protein kinase [Tieghemostelium lacteum]|uniref:cAMP-dependent protein kinase n=1 Tax=Tieghemostelium lacteum TaxID=361077 RepID=A0A151ZAU8_TIELA|nr:cAMP-dependent protein kinase [Tieghemostelium lacteum]|eukprot:KYQ91058.1 cAMP-dependent protein kinase [Tieghemostelium lacteum]